VQRAILVVAALSLMPIVPALAQHPSGVAVVFHAQLPLYKLSPTAEQEISSRAAKSLAEKLPYWQYKAGGDTDFPQLRVEVLRENSGKLLLGMSLMLAPAGTSLPAGSWKDALFAPGDFLLSPVLPKEPEAPKFFSDAFEQRILSNAAIVHGLLIILSEAVPLGRTVVLILPPLNSDSPRAVLPIEWKDHCHEFAESEFVILSRTTTNEKVKLYRGNKPTSRLQAGLERVLGSGRTGELLPESRRSGAAGFGLKRKGTSGAPNADRIPLEGRQSSFCVVR